VKIGVAVPTRNVAPFIETCLTSINAQTHPCAAYIVDDASDDGCYEFLADRPTWWRRLSRHEERQGWPASLNAAAAMAIGDGCDAVFVMNADDWLRLDCIAQCVRLLQRCDAVVPYTQQIGGQNVVQASAGHVTPDSFVDHTPLVAFGLVRADVDSARRLPRRREPARPLAGYNEWDLVPLHQAGYLHNVVTEPTVYYRMHGEQLHHDTTARR
jgi:glycosyltransferase involved in cell wall biosynthesis